MKNYLFIPAALERIAAPDFFTRICAWALRVFAAFVVLGALIGWLQLWKSVFNMSGAAILGGVLFQLFFATGAYMVLHVLWIRLQDIEQLDTKEWAVIPLLPLFFKMIGEVYACMAVAAGMGKGTLHLFVDHSRLAERTVNTIPGIGWEQSLLADLLGGSDGISSFISALLLAVGGAISAVVWLTVFYLLAETIALLLNAARDLRLLREAA